MPAQRLSQYPHVRLRIACTACGREGRYNVARLAEKHGAEIPLADLLARLTHTCKWHRPPGAKPPGVGAARCRAGFPDLAGPTPGRGAMSRVA